MSLQQRAVGKSIVVKLEDFEAIAKQIVGGELYLDNKETTVDINTKVWFGFNKKTREVWMEVAV